MGTSSNIVEQFFVGTTEHVFQVQLGLVEPRMTDYLSAMLLRFVRTDQLYKVRGLCGKPIMEVVDMVKEACCRYGVAKKRAQQHVGDFTLFWAGFYPEALNMLSGEKKKDCFVDYCAQGKRSYYLAAQTIVDEQDGVSDELLLSLSDRFEMCAYGLREVRREWEKREGDASLVPITL